MRVLTIIICLTGLAKISFTQPGLNDPNFNVTDIGAFGSGTGLGTPLLASKMQPDGKILMGSADSNPTYQYNGTTQLGLSRINPDGSVDTSFNIGSGFNANIFSISLQTDGKIVVGGTFTVCNGITRNGIARLNSDGSLDTTFNPGTGFPFSSAVRATAIQADGKIIAAGIFNSYNGVSRSRIVRINTDGSLDLTFTIGTGFTGLSSCQVMAIDLQSDGKLVAVGDFYGYNGTTRGGIARLNSNGSLDLTFNPGSGFNGTVWDLELQTDGKIVAVGVFSTYNGTNSRRIARINTNGSIDATFLVGSGFNNNIGHTVKIHSDGKLVVAGSFSSYNGTNCWGLTRLNPNGTMDLVFNANSGPVFISGGVSTLSMQIDGKIILIGPSSTVTNGMMRLNVDGSLDYSFNGGSGFNSIVHVIRTDVNNKILVGGDFSIFNSQFKNRIARLNLNGTSDTTFHSGLGFNNSVTEILGQVNGKIIVGGNFTNYNGISSSRIIRLTFNGGLDTSFNPGSGFDNKVNQISIQSDGKYIIGGSFTNYNGTQINRIARINDNGSIDPTFNLGSGFNAEVLSIIIQSDDKIVVSGSFTSYNGIPSNNIIRLNMDGSIDPTFNIGIGFNQIVQTTCIQSDGKILAGGNFTTYNGINKNRIIRLNNDGSIDNTFNPGTGFNNLVRCINIQVDGKIIVGGEFTLFNNTNKKGIIRLNNSGSADNSFVTGTGYDDKVYTLAVQNNDGKILTGGNYNSYNGIPRKRISRILNCYTSYDTITISVCDVFVLNGQNYSTSGIFTQVLTNYLGCDSIITLNLTVLSTNDMLNISACNNYIFNGQTYTSSGVYIHQFTNVYSCDSIITLNLTIFNSSSNTITVSACSNYFYNGNNLTVSGQYIDSFTNASGCDSIVTLNLTILQPSSSSVLETACFSYNWPVNNQIYTASGQYIDTINNVAGCDSIITLNLIILQASSSSVNETTCDSYTWPVNNFIYTYSGQYVDTITNVAGCDSIITLNLTIIPSLPLTLENLFTMPSDANNCVGEAAIMVSGNTDFELDIDNGSQTITSSGYSLISNLCPGIHDLHLTDNCGDTLLAQFVIAVDSNYVFNNPFIDSLAMDSLGITMTDCDIFFNGIDTAYIDSIWANGNIVNVIWNIVDSNGSNFDTTSYVLNNGNGVYWLQLSVFCPNKEFGDYFTVTEAIYFNNGNVSMAGLEGNHLSTINLYPNPTTDKVTINMSITYAHLFVYDIQGKLIAEQNIVSGSEISMLELETGVYLFEIVSESSHIIQRVVKN